MYEYLFSSRHQKIITVIIVTAKICIAPPTALDSSAEKAVPKYNIKSIN